MLTRHLPAGTAPASAQPQLLHTARARPGWHLPVFAGLHACRCRFCRVQGMHFLRFLAGLVCTGVSRPHELAPPPGRSIISEQQQGHFLAARPTVAGPVGRWCVCVQCRFIVQTGRDCSLLLPLQDRSCVVATEGCRSQVVPQSTVSQVCRSTGAGRVYSECSASIATTCLVDHCCRLLTVVTCAGVAASLCRARKCVV